MGKPAPAFPRIKCVVTIGDETSELWTNPLSMYRAEKALGHSVITGIEAQEFSAIAALCYSVSAATNPDFLKSVGGNHAKGLEAWLAMEPDFTIDLDADEDDEVDDGPPADPGSSGSS